MYINKSLSVKERREPPLSLDPLEVDVQLHLTLVLLAVPLALAHADPAAAFLTVATLALAVLINAAGQSMALCRLGLTFTSLRLMPTGAVAEPALPRSAKSEFLVDGAGIAGNLLLATLLTLALPVAEWTGGPEWRGLISYAALLFGGFALLHLMPCHPFAAGRLFRAVLASRLPFRCATGITLGLTCLMAAAMLAGARAHPLLLLLSGYLWLTAIEEARLAWVQPDLAQPTLGVVRRQRLPELSRSDTVRTALTELFLLRRQSLPVVENNRLVGVVELGALLRRVAVRGGGLYTSEVMLPPPAPLALTATLQQSIARMEDAHTGLLPLEDAAAPMGFVTREQLLDLITTAQPRYLAMWPPSLERRTPNLAPDRRVSSSFKTLTDP